MQTQGSGWGCLIWMYTLCTAPWTGTYLHGAIGTTDSPTTETRLDGMKTVCRGTVLIRVGSGLTVCAAGKNCSTVKVCMKYFMLVIMQVFAINTK